MTYCVAKKGAFGVVMAADSALTSDASPKVKVSSFGERHGPLDALGPERFVQEGKLKIEVIGDCDVTYAGDVSEIELFIREFRAWLGNRRPLEAFKITADANSTSKSQIILGYLQDAVPRIATFNAKGESEVIDDVEFAAFGNLDMGLNRLTETNLTLFEKCSNDSTQVLVNTLALLQSYGIHRYLISDGVGGGSAESPLTMRVFIGNLTFSTWLLTMSCHRGAWSVHSQGITSGACSAAWAR